MVKNSFSLSLFHFSPESDCIYV
uniref:Uncharacterized protein n=1 Tax=Arundo donax TaxID=35708 RepID=A0A0A8YEP3_ARUDO